MKRHELWTELETQKVLLLDQQKRVYQQYRMLLDAVLAGQITEWQEVLGRRQLSGFSRLLR